MLNVTPVTLLQPQIERSGSSLANFNQIREQARAG